MKKLGLIEADCISARDSIARVHKELELMLGTPNAGFWLGVAKAHASTLNHHLHQLANAIALIEMKKNDP